MFGHAEHAEEESDTHTQKLHLMSLANVCHIFNEPWGCQKCLATAFPPLEMEQLKDINTMYTRK